MPAVFNLAILTNRRAVEDPEEVFNEIFIHFKLKNANVIIPFKQKLISLSKEHICTQITHANVHFKQNWFRSLKKLNQLISFIIKIFTSCFQEKCCKRKRDNWLKGSLLKNLLPRRPIVRSIVVLFSRNIYLSRSAPPRTLKYKLEKLNYFTAPFYMELTHNS